ncbi:MAG: hypothetical protein CMI31_08980 [Opitutae bacterium]|nr:hypothetical protein [Opitutae bacterium]
MSDSEDLEGDSLAELIDDTDGQEVETVADVEPTSSIPDEAVAEGDDVDVGDPALADIMADDGPESESPAEPTPAPAPEVVAPAGSTAPASSEDEQAFRSQVGGLAAPDDVERIITLRRALVQRGESPPALTDVAADVLGSQLVAPEGDCDFYGNRPSSRAQGWVTGLAFGSQRRAKRFAKF